MIERNNTLAARLHWALLPAIGEYYYAEEYGEKVPLRWRVGYRLMKLVKRLPSSDLYLPLEPVVCDCDECRAAPFVTLGEICEIPVSDWADQSAHLYLWTTNEHLRYAFSVVGAWGFTLKNVLVWCKPGLGMGGTFRNAHELILLGERGKCELKRRDQGTWFVLPNPRDNSAKPDGFLDLVESVSHGPYLELFARRQRLGWDTWGNEALEHVSLPVGGES